MKQRLQAVMAYIIDRLGESSTWQAVGFFATLAGAKWGADMDWGGAAAAGGAVSGLFKAFFPDQLKKPKA
jgi:hypothetical protein